MYINGLEVTANKKSVMINKRGAIILNMLNDEYPLMVSKKRLMSENYIFSSGTFRSTLSILRSKLEPLVGVEIVTHHGAGCALRIKTID